MNPLGVHALVFVSGWNQEEAARAIDQAALAGFSHLEIPLIDPRAIDADRTARALEAAGITPIASLCLGVETDISSGDLDKARRGEVLLDDALLVARDLGASLLSGPLYASLGKDDRPANDAGRWHALKILRQLAERASHAGMTIGIEPVNRYESNLINTGEQALELIETIGAENMIVHLDSYHMNIEEGPIHALISRLGRRLGYVHVSESHRGYLGTGNIDFDALFETLIAADYQGVITFEAFSANVGDPALNAERATWRPLFDDPMDVANRARTFMAAKLKRAIERPRRQERDDASEEGDASYEEVQQPKAAPSRPLRRKPHAKPEAFSPRPVPKQQPVVDEEDDEARSFGFSRR